MSGIHLWENYRNVCFIAPFEPVPAFAIITAWDPASRRVGMRRNLRRQQALLRTIASSAEMRVLGLLWGSSPDESWREASLALASSRVDAIRLAARFGQNAIYWVEGGELWLIPVLMSGEPEHLGGIGSYWRIRA